MRRSSNNTLCLRLIGTIYEMRKLQECASSPRIETSQNKTSKANICEGYADFQNMWSISGVFFIFVLGLYASAAQNMNRQSDGAHDGGPFGITFGPTSIMASRVNASNQIEIFSSGVNAEYKRFFANTVAHFGERIEGRGEWYIRNGGDLVPAPDHTHDEKKTESLFRDNFVALQHQLRNAYPDQSPRVSALHLPGAFNLSTRHSSNRSFFDYSKLGVVTKTG